MASAAAAIDHDYLATAAGFTDGGDELTTGIEDLPVDVLALVLCRLDGASLAALGCASSAFRDLAADPDGWRALCLATWPSVQDAVHLLCSGDNDTAQYRQLFADAFPFPTLPPAPETTSTSACLPARLVSAVDLHHGGACIMSRVIETDTSSAWFLGTPFRVDALVQEGFSSPSSPITPSELSLSWLLVDPSTGRAVNASSRRPVSVTRHWLTGETVARFAVALDDNFALDAAVTCDERRGHVREVSLRVEDGTGDAVSGKDGLAVVAAAMTAGARRRLGRGAEEDVKVRYEEFVKGKAARKARVARREGVIDLCCSGVGAAAFVSFLVMLAFR